VSLAVRHTIITNPHGHHVLIGALDVSTAPPATNLRLDLETTTGTFLLLRGSGWTCTGIGTAQATCETDKPRPAPFILWINQIPPVFEFQATVQAADNSDPDPANNAVSFSGPGGLG
jgi:hypothetical protein